MIVMMGVRNPEGSRKSVEEALGVDLTQGRVFYEQCDTGDLESVKQFAKKVQQKLPAFHLLINNGGRLKLLSFSCCSLTNDIYHFSWCHVHALQRIQRRFRITNGHQLPRTLPSHTLADASTDRRFQQQRRPECKSYQCLIMRAQIHRYGLWRLQLQVMLLMWNFFLKTKCSWIDQHFRKFYYPADAYNKSKLAQVLFTKSLEKIFADHELKIQSHSLHPGVVNTDLFEHSSTDYIPWMRKLFFKVS